MVVSRVRRESGEPSLFRATQELIEPPMNTGIPRRNSRGIPRLVDALARLPPSVRRQSSFLLRRRMNITTPNKTAITPQIRRKVVVSMDKLSFLLLIGQLHVFNHRDQIAHQAR